MRRFPRICDFSSFPSVMDSGCFPPSSCDSLFARVRRPNSRRPRGVSLRRAGAPSRARSLRWGCRCGVLPWGCSCGGAAVGCYCGGAAVGCRGGVPRWGCCGPCARPRRSPSFVSCFSAEVLSGCCFSPFRERVTLGREDASHPALVLGCQWPLCVGALSLSPGPREASHLMCLVPVPCTWTYRMRATEVAVPQGSAGGSGGSVPPSGGSSQGWAGWG